MRVSVRLSWLPVLGLAVAPLSCSSPTDKSSEVFVVVVPSDSLAAHGILDRGGRDQVFARAYHRLTNGDSVQLTNIAFTWFSSDKNIAAVEGGVEGSADVTGVNPGVAQITARAVPFEKALDGAAAVRVADRFIIDSIRPLSLNFGDKLRFYGVRIQQLFGVSQGFGSLTPDVFSYTGNLEGIGAIDYWVPYPSTSAHPFFIGPGFFGNATDSITVGTTDLFEPDTLYPTILDVNNGSAGLRTIQGHPTLFFNPALFYEPVSTGSQDVDWYRFDRSDTGAVSFILESEVFGDTAFTFFSDSLLKCGPVPSYCYAPPSGWYTTAGRQVCNGSTVGYNQPRLPRTIIALKTPAAPRMHLLSFYSKSGGYSLVALKGYFQTDSRIGPDRFEENDLCFFADSNFVDSLSAKPKIIRVGIFSSFSDSTLTIDNPQDNDWYRFRVAISGFGFDTTTTIQTKSRPFFFIDPSDIDIYVFRQSDKAFMGSSQLAGSSEKLTLNNASLPAGEYYLLVVDRAGQPTRYSVCIVRANACTPPGSALAANITAPPHKDNRTRPVDPRSLLLRP